MDKIILKVRSITSDIRRKQRMKKIIKKIKYQKKIGFIEQINNKQTTHINKELKPSDKLIRKLYRQDMRIKHLYKKL